MGVFQAVLVCSISLLLLAALAPAAPVTTATPPSPATTPRPAGLSQGEEAELTTPSSSNTTSSSSEEEEEAEVQSSSGAFPELTTSLEGEVIVTTESVHDPYDCSATSPADQAHAIASYRRGISLIRDNLHDRHLRNLVVTPNNCQRDYLSILNGAEHNFVAMGVQGVANTVARLNGYAALVEMVLETNPGHQTMQALHDILQGIVQDVHLVLSPAYCSSCLGETSSCPFTIPKFRTNFFRNCDSLVSYIANTIRFELQLIQQVTDSWLDRQVTCSLPTVNAREWLDAHVHEDSPAYEQVLF